MRIKRSILMFLFMMTMAPVVCAGIFGEAAFAVGGTFPQGSFTRYADPGGMLNLRATLHIPKVEMFVLWANFSYVIFSSETIETEHYTHHQVGNNTWTEVRPVDQVTEETMHSGHIGLQLGSMTRRAFFRPRAALGIGFYSFSHEIVWTEEDGDSTIVVASESLDSQFSFGWRVLLGVDFFITSQWGVTADFVYDHVFQLNQTDGFAETATKVDTESDLTSRFHGFTVGVVYMFSQ